MIEIALPVYDDGGLLVDTTTANLSQEQIQDIITQAIHAVYADRAMLHSDGGDVEIEAVGVAMGELSEALESYGVIEEDDYFPGKKAVDTPEVSS